MRDQFNCDFLIFSWIHASEMSPFCHSRHECIKPCMHIYVFTASEGIWESILAWIAIRRMAILIWVRGQGVILKRDLIFRWILQFTYGMWMSRGAKSWFSLCFQTSVWEVGTKKRKKKTNQPCNFKLILVNLAWVLQKTFFDHELFHLFFSLSGCNAMWET